MRDNGGGGFERAGAPTAFGSSNDIVERPKSGRKAAIRHKDNK